MDSGMNATVASECQRVINGIGGRDGGGWDATGSVVRRASTLGNDRAG